MTVDLKVLAEQIAQYQAATVTPSTTTVVSVGVTEALLRSAIERRSDKAMGTNILLHFREIEGLEMVFADGSKTPEQATKALKKFQSVAKEAGAELELRAYFSFELISELLDMFADVECNYAAIKLQLLEPRIHAKKAKSIKEEGVLLPSFDMGAVTGWLDFDRVNNPMSDSAEFATEDELLELIKQQAIRSRAGYKAWQQGQMTNGKKEESSSKDQSLEDLA